MARIKPNTDEAEVTEKPEVAPEKPEVPKLEAVAEVKRGTEKRLQSGRLKLAEQVVVMRHIHFTNDVTVEDIESPEYWTHVGHTITANDRFTGTTDDGTRLIEGVILACGKQYAIAKVLQEYRLDAVPERHGKQNFKAEYAGAYDKWRVIRIADNEVMRAGFQAQREAVRWIDSHEQALRR